MHIIAGMSYWQLWLHRVHVFIDSTGCWGCWYLYNKLRRHNPKINNHNSNCIIRQHLFSEREQKSKSASERERKREREEREQKRERDRQTDANHWNLSEEQSNPVFCTHNSPVRLGVTTSYDQLRPATTSKLSVVFGSLQEVADHRVMVTGGRWWSFGVSGTSLWPNGRRLADRLSQNTPPSNLTRNSD